MNENQSLPMGRDKMKNEMNATRIKNIYYLVCAAVAFGIMAHAQSADPQTEQNRELMVRFDTNGNGEIDASEHKEFARERARLVKAKALEEAKKRPPAKPGERIVVRPARWTPELFKKYDAN